MIISLLKGGEVYPLVETTDFLDPLICALPDIADRVLGGETEKRLFPDPISGLKPAADSEAKDRDGLSEEWKEYVHPELKELFAAASSAIRTDLAAWEAEGETTLKIPEAHLDQWIHCLARARLILTQENAFTDEELEGTPRNIENERDLELLRLWLYGDLEVTFIRHGWGFTWDKHPLAEEQEEPEEGEGTA